MAQPTDSQRLTVQASGGRMLDVLAFGPRDGLALVFHTGTPGGLTGLGPMTGALSARGLRTVLYARPGYGDSTPQPGRRVADAAADVGAILERLGIDEFVTAGWSGGGPHALACAALSTGIAGWRDDDLAFIRDWGISLEALGHATPVAIWQGDQDRMVPTAHGDWLAANIPLSADRRRAGEGHLTLMAARFGEILDDLLSLAGKGR